jgi:uncharacterized OsmC-like protein
MGFGDVWSGLNTRSDVDDPVRSRTVRSLGMVGRLREGVTVDAAPRDLSSITADLGREHPATDGDRGVTVISMCESNVDLSAVPTMAAVRLFLTQEADFSRPFCSSKRPILETCTTYRISGFPRIDIMVAPRTSRHSVVASSAGNLAFSASVRSHRVFTDQTVRGGGNDSAPTPLELLSAALASCVALHVFQFCEGKGFDAQDLAVEVKPLWRENPGRIARLDIVLHIPDTIPASYRDAIDEVVRGCPVYQTFAHAPAMECRQVTGALVLGAA